MKLVGIAAGLAAFAASAHQALLPVPPLATGARPRPALAPGRLGPEGVPIPAGPALAPPRALRDGEQIDGISCQVGEHVAFHIHVHLRIVVRGRSREVPAGIGVAPPYEVEPTPAGRFVARASCFMWLHTRTRPTASSTSSRPCRAPTRSASSSTSGANR